MKTAFYALAATLPLVSACSADTPDTELEEADTVSEAEAMARDLPAGEFMDLQLGGKIKGPQGEELNTGLYFDGVVFADLRSFVACPAGMDPCDPATAPAGTVYTYVHTIFPGGDNDPDTGDGEGADNSHVERAQAFRMTRPAHGFTGGVGYSKLAAAAAMGEPGKVIVTCVDGGLAWTLYAGDGGDQWEFKEPLTVYWQSTLPPAGPANAYAIDADYTLAGGEGPYPAASSTAMNACLPGA